MMAKVINLRQVRKQTARVARARAGDENAARHGLTPAERRRLEAEAARADQTLSAHRREQSEAPPGD